ncbi:hypothetical protein Droror1_Dr00027945, partial [Drosera rotundifolia]
INNWGREREGKRELGDGAEAKAKVKWRRGEGKSARSLLPFTLPHGKVCRLENRRLEKDSPPPKEEKFAGDPQAAK